MKRPLEDAKSADMMRLLEHGMKVKMIPTKYNTKALDTKEDLEAVHLLVKPITISDET